MSLINLCDIFSYSVRWKSPLFFKLIVWWWSKKIKEGEKPNHIKRKNNKYVIAMAIKIQCKTNQYSPKCLTNIKRGSWRWKKSKDQISKTNLLSYSYYCLSCSIIRLFDFWMRLYTRVLKMSNIFVIHW